MIKIILPASVMILAGFFKAIMDLLAHNKQFWNIKPTNKWFNFQNKTCNNKYKNNDSTQGEKFFGSTTFLVLITDAWHFYQFLFHITIISNMVILGILIFEYSILSIIMQFIVLYISLTLSFQIFYSLLQSK